MAKRILAFAAVLALGACSIPLEFGTPGPKCPPTYAWSKQFRDRLSARVAALEDSDPLTEAVAQLVETRDWQKENCR